MPFFVRVSQVKAFLWSFFVVVVEAFHKIKGTKLLSNKFLVKHFVIKTRDKNENDVSTAPQSFSSSSSWIKQFRIYVISLSVICVMQIMSAIQADTYINVWGNINDR